MKLKSGTWLLVKHGTLEWLSDSQEELYPINKGRSHLTAYVSYDEGQSWQGGLLLEERDCSYPFGCQAADGSIYVSYERQRWRQPEILLAKFSETAVALGKQTSDIVLRQLVNKASGETITQAPLV
jgi:hypothetical protein